MTTSACGLLLGASKLRINPIGIRAEEALLVTVAVVEPVRAIIESFVKPALKVIEVGELPILGITKEAISSEELGQHKIHSE